MEQFRFTNNLNNYTNKYKLCIVYFILIVIILVLLIINYVTTNSAFKDNFQINLNSTGICHNYTKQLDDCSNRMASTFNNCSIYKNFVVNCEISVEEFNKKCGVYSSELNLCLYRDDYDCEDIFYDLMACNVWDDMLFLNKTIFKSQKDGLLY